MIERSEPKIEPPKRKRRWFQFSLRTLLGVVTVLAAVSAWLGAKWHAKLEERRIVEELRQEGADIYYDYEADNWFTAATPNPTPPGPAWARGLLGDDAFTEPVYVSIRHSANDQATLAKLERLTSLTALHLDLDDKTCQPFHTIQRMSKLNGLGITGPVNGHDIADLLPMPGVVDLWLGAKNGSRSNFDDGVCRQIKRVFPGLKTLTLQGKVSNAGVESLSGMQLLETLELTVVGARRTARLALHDCPRLKTIRAGSLTDGNAYSNSWDAIELTNLPALECLEAIGYSIHLSGLPKLRELDTFWVNDLQLSEVEGLEEIDFSGSELPPSAFERLLKCPKLRFLNLRAKTQIDGALEYIGRLSSLKKLDLSNSSLTDSGSGRLTSLPNLEELNLSDCEITDASLEPLHRLKSLRLLNLKNTRVTPAGVKRIETAIPELKCVTE